MKYNTLVVRSVGQIMVQQINFFNRIFRLEGMWILPCNPGSGVFHKGETRAYIYEFKVDGEYFQHDTLQVNDTCVVKVPHG